MRIAICSKDTRCYGIIEKVAEKTKTNDQFDWRRITDDEDKWLDWIDVELDRLTVNTIHAGTRYDHELVTLGSPYGAVMQKTRYLIEKALEKSGRTLNYDRIYVVYNDDIAWLEYTEDLKQLSNNVKVIPERPASISCSLILRDLKNKGIKYGTKKDD